MLRDVTTFESEKYFVQDNGIGYKELDGISYIQRPNLLHPLIFIWLAIFSLLPNPSFFSERHLNSLPDVLIIPGIYTDLHGNLSRIFLVLSEHVFQLNQSASCLLLCCQFRG